MSLKCFILWWTLLQILFEVLNSQISTLQPQGRIFHTATFINDKLYILGGESVSTNAKINEIIQKDFFYLDFSKSFNNTDLSWKFLLNTEVPSRWDAASVKGGINNDTLFLYGGLSSLKNDSVLVYTYETQNDLWRIPDIKVDNITRKRSLEAIIDYNGKMYLFGGSSDKLGSSNSMIILDTKTLIWKTGSLINAPAARFYYGAALLPDQNIIYFGGNSGEEILGLDTVYLYDTINDIWNTKNTLGLIPSKRYLFSTVLRLDGNGVIIFGGYNVAYTDSLYVLDTINFEWYIPKVTGNLPANRYSHKANIIGNFMVVSFGFGYVREKESDILLLNVTNNEEYNWSIIYEPSNSNVTFTSSTSPPVSSPPPTSPPTNTPVSSNNLSSTTSKTILIAAIIVSILFVLCCFFL